MGDRYNLCRLLSSIDDDLSSDESTFFEWARKTSSFSELVSAFRALQLSKRIANVPQLDGPKPALYLIGLWRSFLERDNTVILMPNLVNLERLPLLMCATYMTRQATRHIVWLVKESDIAVTKSKVRKLAESRNWVIGDLDAIVEGQFQRGFGSKPTLDIVTPDTYATMLREGAPLSRVALLLVSCTADLLVDSAPHYKSLTWIFNRYSQETPSVRPKVALFANQTEISSVALSDVLPQLSAYVPNLSVATLSPSDLDHALQPLKQAPQSYFSDIPVPSPYVDPLHTYLCDTIRKWLNIYVTEAETASQHGTFRLEVTGQPSDQSEFQRRAKYLHPLLPFHQYLEPIVFENGFVNQLFTQQLDFIEQRWTKSGAKLLLLSIRHLCTTISLLGDIGILDSTKYLITEMRASLASIGKRTGKNSILDQLFDGLTDAQSFLTQYQATYLGIVNTASENRLTEHQTVAQRYDGRLGFLLRLLNGWNIMAYSKMVEREPAPDVPEVLDSRSSDKDFDVTGWTPRFIVYLSDPTLATPIKNFLTTHTNSSEIFMLGEATDEVLCDDFFAEVKESPLALPKVLLSVPSSLRIVHESLKNHYQAHLQTSHPKYVPGAQYGPNRNHEASIPASASLPEFSPEVTKDAVIILRLDIDSPAAILREAQESEYPGEVVLGLKTSTYSLSAALEAYSTQREDYKNIVALDRDIFAEIKQTLEDIKAKQLKPYVTSSQMASSASPMAPKMEIAAPLPLTSPQTMHSPVNPTIVQNTTPSVVAPPASVTPYNSSKSSSMTPTPQFIEEIVTPKPTNDARGVKSSDPWMSIAGLSITTADPWIPKNIIEDPLQDEGGSVNYVRVVSGNRLSPTPGDPSLTPTPRNVESQGFSTNPSLEMRSGEERATLTQKTSLMTPAELKQRSMLYQQVLDDHDILKTLRSFSPDADKADDRSLDLISALGMPAVPQGSTSKMMPGRRSNGLSGDLLSPTTLTDFTAAELAAAGVSGSAVVAPVLSTSPRSAALGFGSSPWSYGSDSKLESSNPATLHLFGKSSVMESILGDDALEGISSLKTKPSLSSATSQTSATNHFQTSPAVRSASDLSLNLNSLSHETSVSSPMMGYGTTGAPAYTPTGTPKSAGAIAPPKASSVGIVNNANDASGAGSTKMSAPSGAAANGMTYTARILAALGMAPMRSDTNTDPVSLLHIHCSKTGETDPTYDEVMCGGTDHARKYRSTCTFSTGALFEGWGMRKKDAKKAAAAYALEYVTKVPASAYFDEVALPSSFHGSRTGPQGTSFSALQDTSVDPALAPRTAAEPNNGTRSNPSSLPHSATRAPLNPLSPSYGPSTTTQNGSNGGNKHNFPPGLAKAPSTPYGYPSAQSSPISFSSLSSSNSQQASRRPGTTTAPYNTNGATSPSALPDVAGASEYFPAYLTGSLGASSSSSPYGTTTANGAGEANKTTTSKPATSASTASSTGGFASSAPYDWATAITNPIGIVNEYHQKKGLRPPAYTDCGRTSGTDHEPHFLCKVVIYDGRGFDARGTSKKEAKTQAALQVAMALNLIQEPK